MKVFNAELLRARGTVKFIMNDEAIMFFPATRQHRDIKAHGLSYEDEHRGNALAGLVTETRVEIRFHGAYSDERIRGIWTRVLATPEVADAGLGPLYYQGRQI